MKAHFTTLTRIGNGVQGRETDPAKHEVQLDASGWVGVREISSGESRFFPPSQIEFLEVVQDSSDGRTRDPQPPLEPPPLEATIVEPPPEPPRKRGRPRKNP